MECRVHTMVAGLTTLMMKNGCSCQSHQASIIPTIIPIVGVVGVVVERQRRWRTGRINIGMKKNGQERCCSRLRKRRFGGVDCRQAEPHVAQPSG